MAREEEGKEAVSGEQPVAVNEKSPLVRVHFRNRGLHVILLQMLGVTSVAVAAAVLSMIVTWWSLSVDVPPEYVQATEDGRILPLIPLHRPNMDASDIGEFALSAVRAMHTYDYINYRVQFQHASSWFSSKGWSARLQEYASAQTMNTIQARKMIVSVRPTGEPQVVREGLTSDNLWVWRVEVPIEIDYVSHDGNSIGGNKQRGVAELFISRVPVTDHPKGAVIQIYRFVTTDR